MEVAAASVTSAAELASLLRRLRRREARSRNAGERTHRELAALVGCSPASIGFYLSGAVLPAARRLDELARQLGATPQERAALVAARDRAADARLPRPLATSEIPRTLPPVPAGFVGRAVELAELDAALGTDGTERAGGRMPVTIAAVSGMGGVGKTALALHWAHRSAHRYPDGQLYVDLRGFGPREPITAGTALQTLLAALNVPAAAVPSDVDERAALYRALLRGRRMLVLLDNAADVGQVRPLLPEPPGVALVTSRDRLPELVADQRVTAIALDVMSEAEATELLRGLVGPRCDREPDAVRGLLSRTGRLPLALRVVAEIASARPAVPLADLIGELGADRPTLDAYGTGDAASDVRQVFSWSLRTLPAPVARAFRLLGVAPTETVDAYGMAALAGVDPEEAQTLLDALARAHLVSAGPGRHRVHDLLRAYAMEVAERELHPDARRAAEHRQLDYYLAAAVAATDVRFPYRVAAHARRPQPVDEVRIPDMSTMEAATAWLSAHRSGLVRLVVDAAASGRPAYAIALALTLAPLLDQEFNDDALAVFHAAHTASLDDGDPIERAHLERCLGYTYLGLGRFDEAAAAFDRAIAGFSSQGRARDALPSVVGLGNLRAAEGRFDEARAHLRRGVEIARDAAQPMHEAVVWGNLATTCLDLEDWDGAEECARNALALFTDHGQTARPQVYVCLARAAEGCGRYEEATDHALVALDLASTHSDVMGQIYSIDTLASIGRALGRYDEAAQSLEATLQTHRTHCRADLLAQVLNTLGELYLAAGSPSLAQERYDEARRHAERNGSRLQVSRALLGLGDTHAALGEPVPAQACWRQALANYAAMHHPAVDRVKARLSPVQ